MKYSAICFDLDGVIINSEPLHEAAFRSALEHYGLALSARDYKTYFAGKTDEQGFIDYLSSQQASIPISDLQILKQQAFASFTPGKSVYYQGATDLIRELAEVTSLALVTGSSSEEAEVALKSQNLRQCFSAIVTADDITYSKPHPESYLLAAKRLPNSIAPAACIAVEDSPSGIQAAKRAGMHCIAVTHTHTPESLNDADTIIERLDLLTFTHLLNE